ncbi:MAG: TetR/AcrR family transcriptional regulator [Succinivibrio sp.]|nr:TetR/AcrR family transcriptional regulator [Succinivibrio sp.]
MKRKSAKELLIESFLQLAEHKPVDKISIKEITDNCGYSAATFYRQFKDKYELIAYDYSTKVQRLIDRMDEKNYSFEDMVADGLLLYAKQKSYLVNLLLHTRGLDAFRYHMVEINYNFLSQRLLKCKGTAQLEESEEIYIRLYCTGCVAIVSDWLLGKYLMQSKDLAQLLVRSLPLYLQQYFY